ncbi:MAG: choice-of-anchor D domain-containing protein [Kofleriaceae bacterium]
MRHVVLGAVLAVAACQSSGPDLSETEQLAVTISPASASLGSVQVGQTSNAVAININPALSGGGPQSNIVNSVTEDCTDFDVNAFGLPAEVYRTCEPCAAGNLQCIPQAIPQAICPGGSETQSYQFSTVFHPSVAGPQSCVVTITLDDGALIRTVTLSGTGTAPPIDIDVQPGSVPFGDVRINTASTAANISVRNLGSGNLDVMSVTATGGYAIGGPTAFGVPAGGAQGITVTCMPTGVGPLNGTLSIASDDPSTPTVTVPLSCSGVDSNLAISPSPAVITPTRVGEPQTQVIALGNSGGASTTLESVTLAGTGITIVDMPAAGTVLNPGGSANVTVAFDAMVHGETSATLTIVTTEGTRTAQISATATLATMALDPDGTLEFGPVCAGKGVTRSFTVLGTSDGSFQLDSISEPAAPFAVVPPALPATVQAQGANQVTFDVSASPDTVGMSTSSIAINTDIPNAAVRTVTLNVEGLAAGVSATPVEVDLGGFAIDETTIASPITLTNCDVGAVELSNPRIEGLDAGDFAIVVQPTSTMIPPNGSAQWLVVLSPHTIGLKEATFAVDHPGGTAIVALLGEGLGDTVPGGEAGGETSYYSCSAGGSSTALVPLGLVVLVVIRRRRRLDPT